MEKIIIIIIILVKIEITIMETIIFEFENMYLFNMSLPKTLCNWGLWNFVLKKYTKWSKENAQIKLTYIILSSCFFDKT